MNISLKNEGKNKNMLNSTHEKLKPRWNAISILSYWQKLRSLTTHSNHKSVRKLAFLYVADQSNGEGNGTPLQYSCLENPMDGGTWWATVHGVAKSWTQLSDFTLIFTFMHWRGKWQPTPVFLPGESQGRESLVGCLLWGCTELDTTEAT